MSGAKVIVLGAGKSGLAAATLLRRQGCEVKVLDGDEVFPEKCWGRGATFLSPQGEEEIPFAVVSPGIPLTHPWIREARRRGIPLKSELQLGCEELKRRGWKLLAVTGSKGKSSVVKLVAEAIGGVACGNYGLPVCEVALTGCGDRTVAARWAVVEVSSFMMETTSLPPDTFEAAAILNLQEDHLDRHGSVEVYHGLKRKLLAMTRRPFGPEPASGEADGSGLMAGSYFDNPVLRANGLAAVALMRVAGLDAAAITKAFRDFEPLPHRMNLVAELDGVRYIDDSKATSLAALVAGVEMAFAQCQAPSTRHQAPGTNHQAPGTNHQAPGTNHQAPGTKHQAPILLIAGGLPKGDDPKVALPILTKRVKKVYLIGQCAEMFHVAWNSAVDCEVSGTMERAVASAKRSAARGDIVLLSPGTASFDQFKGFGERGDVFARLVKKGK